MKRSLSAIVALSAALLLPVRAHAVDRATGVEDITNIRHVLEEQAADWNRGDVENFVKGYWKCDDTVFVGAGGVKRGWQSILDRYRRDYPDRKAMGHLAFSNLEVHVTCADSAYVLGEFELDRQAKQTDVASAESKMEKLAGYFTLYFRKIDGQWLIVADHTTRKADPPTLGKGDLPAKNKIDMATASKAELASTNTAGLVSTSISSHAADADEKFARLADQFMKESLVLSPSAASQMGYHKHIDLTSGRTIVLDELIDDMSLASIDKQRSFYESWGKRFREETPVDSLNAEDAADWHLIDDQIALQMLEFDQIQSYKHNPTVVVEMIGSALFRTLSEDYAPQSARLRHALSRTRQIPKLLDDVKKYLADVDPIFISAAIEENSGNIDLLENDLSKAIPVGSQQRKDYDKVVPPAIKALKDFSQWMRDDLAARGSHRSWCLGKDLYAKKFKLVMEVDVTPGQVLEDAEKQLKDVRTDMLRLALPLHKEMYPGHDDHASLSGLDRENLIIGEVLNRIGEEHPKRDHLQQAIESELASIIQFIKEHKIVSLGARDNLKVVPTPIFEQGALSVAAFHSAPPLNPKSQAEYWVTPIKPSVPDKAAESKLREYNNYTLKWLTIHEALPGHYVQFEHLNDMQPEWRRLLRSLYSNGAYVEGWAEYVAQVMMDEGFLNNDPRFRMVMRKIRLRVLANAILDIHMQTMQMTDQEAMNLMTKQAFQTQAEAEGKLKRAKLTSAQLPTYWVGLSQWLGFRKRYQDRLADKFDLLKFHNAALDEGPLPVPSVEKLLLMKAN